MLFAPLQRFFASSPAIHLLRSPNAPWVLPFLYQQFKLNGHITRVHSELLAELDRYLAELHLTAEESNAGTSFTTRQQSAESYLSTWCSGSTGWLKRFIDDEHTEASYQLTADSELVLAFIHKATGQHVAIGTQAHLRSILNLLNEVASEDAVANPSIAAQLRIATLKSERAEIDRQLRELQSDPEPNPNPNRRTAAADAGALVREQFSMAVAQLEQLKSEFRAVEERFKSITRGVQQRLLDTTASRGQILEYALDAEDVLQTSEQGRSFFEFLKLVHTPEIQDQIAAIVHRLSQLDALADQQESLHSLRGMVPTLLAEAEKILRTTQHLSSTLRRLLDSRSTQHHQQLTVLLRDIRAQATHLAAAPPVDIGLDVEVELDIQAPFERPFWSQPDPFAVVDLQTLPVDIAQHERAIEQLVALERIDWQTLRRNITLLTSQEAEVTLVALLERFPLETGTIELLAYLQIAHEDGHEIDRTQTVELHTRWDDIPRIVRLPEVTFLSNSRRRQRHKSQPADSALATAWQEQPAADSQRHDSPATHHEE